MKNTAAWCLVTLLVLWLSASLVRVENERYALYVGMCRDKLGMTDASCLSKVQTRTAWWWHLYYGLTD
jgi:hypothetical protein